MFSKQNDTGRISRAGKVALSAFLVLQVILSLVSTSALAQTPKPLATPGDLQLYTNGIVWASVRQPDGGVIFGGHFSQVNGVARDNIARLKPDGTLDTSWFAEGSYFNVRALAADPQGNVYFGTSAGTLRRVSVNGKLDPNWLPAITSSRIYALAIDSKGNVYAGGSFTAVSGSTTVSKLARFLSSGALDTTWTPNPGTVYALALDGDDNLYVGGTFSSIGGQSRNKLAKISTTGSGVVDPNWNPGPSITSGAAQINALTTDGAGNLYVGGTFDTISGQKRGNIAKLSTSTGVADPAWAPSADGAVLALACDHKGSIYSGGSFTTMGGKARIDIAKLATDGTGAVDDAWNPSTDNLANNNVSTIAVLPDKIFAGGFFSTLGDQPRHSFAAIGVDGKPGIASDTTQPAIVNAIAAQANGGFIVGGFFSGAGSFIRSNVLRLQANGAVDPNWNAPTDTLDNLYAIGVEAIATDDKTGAVYIGGQFAHVGGQPRTGIAKISGSGSVDLNWGTSTSVGGSPGYDWTYGVEAIALSANGDVYLGGDFSLIGGQARPGLAKISSNGLLDPNWNPAVSNYYGDYGIRTLEVDSDDAVFVGGRFNKVGDLSIYGLAKLSGTGAGDFDSSWKNPFGNYPTALKADHKGNLYTAGSGGILKLSTKDGTRDPNWQRSIFGGASFTSARPPYESGPQIYALALDANGNLYAGGIFSQAGNTSPDSWRSRPFLAKVSTLSGDPVDTGWNPVPNHAVYALASDSKNTLYLGGSFSQIGAQPRSAFAAVPMADAANPTIPDHLNQFGWSGAWYNPTTSGQGILLQIIPRQDGTGTLFGGWFTYDSLYSNRGTGLRWYTLQGPVDTTSKTASVPVYATGFIPSLGQIFTEWVGDALISFADCTHGSLVYSVWEPSASGQRPPVGGGTIALTRLGTNSACTATGDSAYTADFLLSGAWYDPSIANSGLIFDIDPGLKIFFAAWYRNIGTIDPSVISSQRWYTIQAPYSTGATSLDDMPIYMTSGGVFDTPSNVVTTRVGTAKIIFSNCATATLTYSFTEGPEAGKSGALNLSRGAAKPANCNP